MTTDDQLDDALRREFASTFVPYDRARIEALLDVIHAESLIGNRRRWGAPLAAAAAVLVVGSGAAAIGLHTSGAPAGGGAITVPPTPVSSVTPSPSNPPTMSPSNSPTSSPSNPPTMSPSNSPTSSPSNPPTTAPSATDSSEPTPSRVSG